MHPKTVPLGKPFIPNAISRLGPRPSTSCASGTLSLASSSSIAKERLLLMLWSKPAGARQSSSCRSSGTTCQMCSGMTPRYAKHVDTAQKRQMACHVQELVCSLNYSLLYDGSHSSCLRSRQSMAPSYQKWRVPRKHGLKSACRSPSSSPLAV